VQQNLAPNLVCSSTEHDRQLFRYQAQFRSKAGKAIFPYERFAFFGQLDGAVKEFSSMALSFCNFSAQPFPSHL
jgi:hypothetical protein